MKYQYHIDSTLPMNEPIFVFGSNESGIHGAGAAKVARDLYGAKLGVGFGPMGRCWAIPTKNWKVESFGLDASNDLRNTLQLRLNIFSLHGPDAG